MSVHFVASSRLPTQWGDFEIFGFLDEESGREHVALAMGLSIGAGKDLTASKTPLVRIHSECLSGDALFSLRCDCGAQLQSALEQIAEEGCGAVLYLRQEGRGIGLLNKIRAYHLQDEGADTVEANEQLGFAADERDYAMCKDMLEYFGIKKLRLLTNNPKKLSALDDFGMEVVERIPLRIGKNVHNERYLQTKKGKLGHLMD